MWGNRFEAKRPNHDLVTLTDWLQWIFSHRAIYHGKKKKINTTLIFGFHDIFFCRLSLYPALFYLCVRVTRAWKNNRAYCFHTRYVGRILLSLLDYYHCREYIHADTKREREIHKTFGYIDLPSSFIVFNRTSHQTEFFFLFIWKVSSVFAFFWNCRIFIIFFFLF